MHVNFRKALSDAEGRSEYIIAVIADIRGFSAFSMKHESPDTAMYIKRVYLKLIDDYFAGADFYKAAGDGLLFTFTYTEKNLKEVAAGVIESCMRCLLDFPGLCDDDPMINFPVPQNISFGITRGTACCLYSGDETLDYSGHLLNLTARLLDFARPCGIVIDGRFLMDVIPEPYHKMFGKQDVFVRGIAEERPMPVLYLKDYVEIPKAALVPIKADNWFTIQYECKVHELTRFEAFAVNLPNEAASPSKVKVTLIAPSMKDGRVNEGYISLLDFNDFEYMSDAGVSRVALNFTKALQYLAAKRIPMDKDIIFKIQYVPLHPIVDGE